MKVSIQGSTCQWCQIPALREGFAALGHEHIEDWGATDLVFVGNGPYDEYLGVAPDKKLILNVLDIAVQNANVGEYIEQYKVQLPRASRVTAISAFTQWQLRHHCGIESSVIYYPMKPVYVTNVKTYPEVKVLICGRVGDPNKRVRAAITMLIRAGYDEKDVAIVGPEHTGWGVYHGIVDDEVLNNLYNSADYVMMLSKIEGIGLPAVEAACAGAIPIVAPDLSTYGEFWRGSPMGSFYDTFTSTKAVVEFFHYMNANPDQKARMKQSMIRYAQRELRPRFDKVEVAKRILAVADTITHA